MIGSHCPKCNAGALVNITYVPEFFFDGGWVCKDIHIAEHLKISCETCGYSVTKPCHDAPAPP